MHCRFFALRSIPARALILVAAFLLAGCGTKEELPSPTVSSPSPPAPAPAAAEQPDPKVMQPTKEQTEIAEKLMKEQTEVLEKMADEYRKIRDGRAEKARFVIGELSAQLAKLSEQFSALPEQTRQAAGRSVHAQKMEEATLHLQSAKERAGDARADPR